MNAHSRLEVSVSSNSIPIPAGRVPIAVVSLSRRVCLACQGLYLHVHGIVFRFSDMFEFIVL
jgi:hypothetical protein